MQVLGAGHLVESRFFGEGGPLARVHNLDLSGPGRRLVQGGSQGHPQQAANHARNLAAAAAGGAVVGQVKARPQARSGALSHAHRNGAGQQQGGKDTLYRMGPGIDGQ